MGKPPSKPRYLPPSLRNDREAAVSPAESSTSAAISTRASRDEPQRKRRRLAFRSDEPTAIPPQFDADGSVSFEYSLHESNRSLKARWDDIFQRFEHAHMVEQDIVSLGWGELEPCIVVNKGLLGAMPKSFAFGNTITDDELQTYGFAVKKEEEEAHAIRVLKGKQRATIDQHARVEDDEDELGCWGEDALLAQYPSSDTEGETGAEDQQEEEIPSEMSEDLRRFLAMEAERRRVCGDEEDDEEVVDWSEVLSGSQGDADAAISICGSSEDDLDLLAQSSSGSEYSDSEDLDAEEQKEAERKRANVESTIDAGFQALPYDDIPGLSELLQDKKVTNYTLSSTARSTRNVDEQYGFPSLPPSPPRSRSPMASIMARGMADWQPCLPSSVSPTAWSGGNPGTPPWPSPSPPLDLGPKAAISSHRDSPPVSESGGQPCLPVSTTSGQHSNGNTTSPRLIRPLASPPESVGGRGHTASLQEKASMLLLQSGQAPSPTSETRLARLSISQRAFNLSQHEETAVAAQLSKEPPIVASRPECMSASESQASTKSALGPQSKDTSCLRQHQAQLAPKTVATRTPAAQKQVPVVVVPVPAWRTARAIILPDLEKSPAPPAQITDVEGNRSS